MPEAAGGNNQESSTGKPAATADKTQAAPPDDCAMPCWLRLVQRFFFGTITPQDKRKGLEVERALSVVRAFTLLGMIVTFAYGLAEGWLRGAFVASLGGAGAFAIGGLLGFLFGLPRWTDVNVAATQTGDANKKDGDKDGDKAAPKSGAVSRDRAVRPNTNLERVMDWLTTLIVGLGLVHWEGALKRGTETSAWFTSAIAVEGGGMAKNGSAGAAILLAFVTAGFILVYLWSQRYMGEEMARADRDSRLEELQKQIEAKDEQLTESKKRQNEMAEMVAPPAEPTIVPGAGVALQRFAPPEMREERFDISQLNVAARLLGFSNALTSEMRRRYAENKGYYDEPMQDFGPSGRGNVVLSASVEETSPGMPIYRVVLRVTGTSTGAGTSPGYVAFFLHHTLPECIRAVKPLEGVASIEVICAGSFIVGAVIVDGDIRLSLDLAKLPGVPKDFRDN